MLWYLLPLERGSDHSTRWAWPNTLPLRRGDAPVLRYCIFFDVGELGSYLLQAGFRGLSMIFTDLAYCPTQRRCKNIGRMNYLHPA
ncbi:MAG TPA: hypothetical protein VEB88_00645, partial [Candidatus Acidoferrales bacterium]|nr:hypothetical protein [Candidatus Acidoferrales bacterium]